MRPTIATVSLNDIRSNFQLACRMAPASQNIAVIKANAYGHGMVEVARALQNLVPVFAVAMMDEAVQLRDAGIFKPILILQGINHAEDIAEAAAKDFWLLLHEQQQLNWVLSAELSNPVRVWLKLDTGMHRLGLCADKLDQLCMALRSSANVHRDVVLCTQFAKADDLDDPMTTQQIKVIRSCAARQNLSMSIANSAGILFWPQSHADWNRPGYMLYGNSPIDSFETGMHDLKPVMTMNSRLIGISKLRAGEGVGYGLNWIARRDSTIGTIAIGYGDGYPRHAANGTPVLVNGRRVPLTGTVSMDAISVDLTDLDKVKLGDPVELWGKNLNINELAKAAGTIGYEILAGLTSRVPLHYQY